MRHRSVQSRAASFTAMAVMAVAGFGVSAAQANLVLDLQVHGGGTSTTVAAGSVVNLDVFGTVTGATSSAAIQDAFFGVTNTGTIGDLSTVSLASAFTGVATDTTGVTTSTGGTLYGSAGSTSVGSTNSASADGWVFARANSMQSVTPGSQTLLGTLTYTVAGNAAAGSSATLGINTRTAVNSLVVPALWQEDGALKDAYNSNGVYAAGTGVTINVGSTVLKGDMNNDGNVNNQDINPFVLALTNPSAYQTQYPGYDYQSAGDISNDGSFNNQDINPFVSLLTGGGAAPGGIAALAAVPEPTSIGLLGLASLGLVRRRRA